MMKLKPVPSELAALYLDAKWLIVYHNYNMWVSQNKAFCKKNNNLGNNIE